MGIFAALAGIKLGRRITRQPQESAREDKYSEFKNSFNDPGHKFPYSISWLFFNLVLIIGSMIMLTYLDWLCWIILVPLVITMWSIRYKRALHQLMNPKFWMLFILVTMLTSFVFTRGHSGEDALWIGLKEGLRMNFRAGVIIIGLSVLGTELYNPLIRNFFARSSYRNLSLALELSIDSLPLFIRSIPGFKTILKDPVAALHNVVAQATKRLQQLENKKISKRKVFILTGGKGEGKTRFARELKEKLLENNIELRGILTEKVIVNGHLRGYDLFDIRSGKRAKFLRLNSNNSNAESEQIGKYEILPAGLKMGMEILCSDDKPCISIIDEVGKLELDDRGWSECINSLLNNPECHLILTVRGNLVDEVIKNWGLDQENVILNIAETDIQKAANIISYGCNFS
ncbi:MAG: nucleoside-triphosphatase [Bacteroidota bacterium]